MNFKSFFMLDNLITPHVLRFIYWILQFFIIIGSIMAMVGGGKMPGMPGGGGFIGGLLLLLVGSLLLRIYIELLIVIFRIAEDLREVRNMKRKDDKSSPTSL